jgi:4a-hydroxytetrahydrobiopterin dehydratase
MTYEHFNNSFDHPDCFADRRVADLALQRRMGLLSQRRPGFGRGDSGRSIAAWKIMTSELAQKECNACDGETPPLKGDALLQLKNQLDDGWRVVDERQLEKQFKFPDFRHALQFTNRVGQIADEQGHHPDIFLTYGEVRLQIWTHKINGLTENDFILAAKINEQE